MAFAAADSRECSPAPSISQSSVFPSRAASVCSTTSVEDEPVQVRRPRLRIIVRPPQPAAPAAAAAAAATAPLHQQQQQQPIATAQYGAGQPVVQSARSQSPGASDDSRARAATARRRYLSRQRHQRRHLSRARVSHRGGFVGGQTPPSSARTTFFAPAWYQSDDRGRRQIIQRLVDGLERDTCERHVSRREHYERQQHIDAMIIDISK